MEPDKIKKIHDQYGSFLKDNSKDLIKGIQLDKKKKSSDKIKESILET